ncbi:hypothetical protein JCM6882_008827 [Rhodosporidiobolus microsporus]
MSAPAASQSTTSAAASFIQRNRTALIAAAAIATVAVGAGVYYSSSSSSSSSGAPPPSGSSQAKKDRKDRKKKSAAAAGGAAQAKPAEGKEGDKKDAGADEDPLSLSLPAIAALPAQERADLALKLKARGNKLYSAKQYAEAVEYYTKAIACEEQAVFYSNRAACYTNLNDLEKVVEDCTSALRLDSSYVKALNRRATAREQLGGVENLYGALCDFTAAAIIDNFATQGTTDSVERVMKSLASLKASQILAAREPTLPSPTFITAYLTAFRPLSPPALPAAPNQSQGDRTLELAFQALDAKDFAHALTLFNEALDQGPSTAEGRAAALNMRATFKFIMSDAEGALADLDAATTEGEGGARATALLAQSWVKKASVHMELGRPEEAMRDFERALEVEEGNADVFYHRGQVYFITGDYPKAIAEYRRSSELDPSFIFSHIQLAVAQYKSGAQEKALHQFRRLVEKHPESAEVWNYFGELLLDQQRFEEAIGAFDKSLELGKDSHPRNVLPMVNKSLAIFQHRQDFASAEQTVREAVTIDPQCDVGVATLAQLLLQQNKVQEAVGMFERSAEMARTEPELVNALTYENATRAQLAFLENYPTHAEKLGLNRTA